MTIEKEFELLKAKRTSIKSGLTRFKTFVNNYKASALGIHELQDRLKNFENSLEQFDNVQSEMDVLKPDQDESDRQRLDFENSYYPLLANARHSIQEYFISIAAVETARSAATSTPTASAGSASAHIKLPTIELPTFGGAYEHWLQYRDVFKALIHNNDTLTNVQKLQYLRLSLKQDAAIIIRPLELTDSNYAVAWGMLERRFDNKKRIIHNHLKAILSFTPLVKESYNGLRQLTDTLMCNVESLKSLNVSVENWDIILIYIISTKLDTTTSREWESVKHNSELPIFDDIMTFLNEKCKVLEAIKQDKPKQGFNTKSSNSLISINNKQFMCPYCKGAHLIYHCITFKSLSVPERIGSAKTQKLCLNCLKPNHYTSDCRGYKCRLCNKNHNFLLHLENANTKEMMLSEPVKNSTNVVRKTDGSEKASTSKTISCAVTNVSRHVNGLLATAVINIRDRQGNLHEFRALLDSASQSNFITKQACKVLQLKTMPVEMTISGILDGEETIDSQATVTIVSRINQSEFKMCSLVKERICSDLPTTSFDVDTFNIPDDLKLADPHFNISDKIDVLVGAPVFWDLISQGQIKLGKGLPTLQKTTLGWIVSGPLVLAGQYFKTFNVTVKPNTDTTLDKLLPRFWELEELPNEESKYLTAGEQSCEEIFTATTTRSSNGRFVVTLPFKSNHNMGDSKELAIKRFFSIERKLDRNNTLKREYTKFMQEYEALGHMTEISFPQTSEEKAYYLPHHPVVKESSQTTKTRVVFDGSARPNVGSSLNDALLKGPVIQSDLFSILLRFRKHKYVITGDISKMYRQIMVAEYHRRFQRIFWRDSKEVPLKCFQLNTVTYGTTPASYLSTKCLFELASEYKDEFPLASKVIMRDFYVDDLITGTHNLELALSLKHQISSILQSGCLELRKWASNHLEILETTDQNLLSDDNYLHKLGDSDDVKTLGLYWNPRIDILLYTLCGSNAGTITKREILSTIAKIYDPLGLLSPVIIVAKIILQQLWQSKVSWDESLPLHIRTKWIDFQKKLHELNSVRIPRRVLIDKPKLVELHGFCDSSEQAYGACLYLRSFSVEDTITVRLLCSKTRVAPLKRISIPRLELCSALLLARLSKQVQDALELSSEKKIYWSDSTIALAWLKGCPSNWNTFVANRVTKIQSLTERNSWYHVKGNENPADLLTRGIEPGQLMNSEFWWNGPHWLSTNGMTPTYLESETIIPERKPIMTLVAINQHRFEVMYKFSSFPKLRRVISLCLRFISNCRTKQESRKTGHLGLSELEESRNIIAKYAQRSFGTSDMSPKLTKTHSKRFLALSPFIDTQGIFRVGGRLGNSQFEYDKKHPILLPKDNFITKLIILNEHERLLHAGPLATLASLREQFWPIDGRNVVRGVIRKCVRCFRARPMTLHNVMGELPEARTKISRPFSACGVDYGGPFLLKDRKGRGCKLNKAYIALFVCFATRAVHLEIVSDLTTEAFVAALRRFSARRGPPKVIYSDNATNFQGTKNEFSKFMKENSDEIGNGSLREGIEWKFIPASSPHFGGLWEAGIKSVKFHMKRILADASVTFEEFLTVITQIEACLNSRPLSPLSSDPNDLIPLTPAHFLIGEAMKSIPDYDYTHTKENRLSRFERMQQLLQHFWERWAKECISEMQTRNKWRTTNNSEIEIGSLVLIKEDNFPPMKWHMGRITKLHPGKDGKVRVVSVRTAKGQLERSIVKICVLPVHEF